MTVPTLPGITAKTVTSARLTTRVLFSGAEDGTPVIFVHGNASSATYWEETMLALPAGFRGIAMDQRGYGDADPAQKIDATQGLGDLADDIKALMDTLRIEKAHFVGHSAGGGVMWVFMMQYPQMCQTVTLACPSSPYGFGGTKADGSPVWDDFAGSGGGTVNPEFPKLVAAGERGIDNPASPRNIMNAFYWKPPFIPAREEDYLSSLLSTHVGAEDYPGDMTPSSNWPNVAPGTKGLINALTPKYVKNITPLYSINPKPYILWVRGSHDQIIADGSMFEMGFLGSLGAIPGYPGVEAYPPQPMISQTRSVLEQYKANGGAYEELVIEDTAHSPYIEKPAEFNAAFHRVLTM